MRSLRLLFALLLSAVAISCAGGRNVRLVPPAAHYGTGALAGPTRFEREQLWGPADANHWEPVNAADPSSNWVYQMTTGQRPDYLLFRASNDRGRTWHEPRHICRRGVRVPFQYDPQIVVATTGQIDIVCLDGFKPGVVFSSSRDHGDTWTESVRLDGSLPYSDKPTLVISGDGKDVYVAYNVDYALYVTASHDFGKTWNAPVKATTTHYWYYPYSGTVAPSGAIWFAVDGEAGTNQTGDGHVGLVTSSDGGATWREIPFAITHEGAPCKVKHCYPDFFTGEEAVAADRLGNLVFVFAKNNRKHGPNSLFATRSSDGGATWSEPSLINGAGNTTSPAIAAGPRADDFRLVWQDNRNGPNAWNTWFARSDDGGTSWSPAIRLSNVGDGAHYKRRAGYDFPFGDYLGLCVDAEGMNHIIWGEGSAVYHPGGTWWSRGPIGVGAEQSAN